MNRTQEHPAAQVTEAAQGTFGAEAMRLAPETRALHEYQLRVGRGPADRAVEAMTLAARLERQRDDLLAALKACLDVLEEEHASMVRGTLDGTCDEEITQARAAIARATEGRATGEQS